uniref:Adenylate kinase n=1 Tax=Lygus hesperus TaxID=30085 RepID=A0A0A9Y062_LYGHE
MECRESIERGKLLNDSIVNQLVVTKLSSIPRESNYILDGYPRKSTQLLHLYSDGVCAPNIAAFIHLPDEIVITKALGRRICEDCGFGYNVNSVSIGTEYDMPAMLPSVDGVHTVPGSTCVSQ